jgi:hypothetical protein
MAKSKSKASATVKRKSARNAADAKKKNKTQAPEELVKSFSTKYGKNMFSDDGLFFFTPGESARCGLLLQSQQWYLDKADDMGLKDCFVFTPELADELRDEEADIMAQGDVVATDSLEVFVNLIDTLGKFCNFDQKLDTKGKLGEVIGSKFPTYAKVGQAAEFVGLHMRNLLFFETSEQRKVTPVVLAAALYERMESD